MKPHPRRWKSGGCSVVSPAPQAQHCTLTRMRDSRRRRRSSGRPEGTKNRIMQKERQTWSDPSSPEIQRSQPNSGSAPVHFRRGVDIESWKSAGKRRRTPELKIQICITNLRSRLFNPTPNITNSHLHLCADDDSLPAEVWAVVRGARGSAARCRQREALGLCSVSSISIRSAAGPAVPASPFV